MKMSLGQTWKNCLSMWRWIAKEVRKHKGWKYWSYKKRRLRVIELKSEWTDAHGFDNIEFNCFFCDYAVDSRATGCWCIRGLGCKWCPARKIDSNFDCSHTPYDYTKYPIKFYNKLVSLNRKRPKGKKKPTG